MRVIIRCSIGAVLNLEFLEVDNSYKRLFDCFYDGGDREFAIGKIADSCDVKTILLFLKYTANVREEHFLSCMKLCVSWRVRVRVGRESG